MFDNNPEAILARLVDICHQAGEAILQWYDTDMGVTHKADDSPLTKADLASHEADLTVVDLNDPRVADFLS